VKIFQGTVVIEFALVYRFSGSLSKS